MSRFESVKSQVIFEGGMESYRVTSVTLHATTTPTAGRYTSGVKSVFSRKRLFTTRYSYGRKKQTPVLQY